MSAQPAPVGYHDARLSVPETADGSVDRRRLTHRLDEVIRSHPVTIVTGAGGTGKTYAVAMWSRSLPADGQVVVAWASLDRADGDPHRFWLTVVGALQRVLDTEEVAGLAVPALAGRPFVDRLAGALAAVDERLVLVLDDVHELAGSASLEALEQLLRALRGRHRVVLLSRHDPPLHLHRARLSGDLGEIRAAELAFTPAEAAELLSAAGVDLPEQTLDRLMTTTEGWAAGLRLATVAIEPAADPAAVLGAFSGRHALVSAYLLEEVVAGLGPERADFLVRTSVVDRVCGPLARALTDDPASGAVLESLVADNVLVTALEDTGWFRYHPMLLEMLRARLRSVDPDLSADLHRRAQGWFESTGEWLEALRHAILSGDQDLAAQVALRSAAVLVFTPERVRLAEVLAGLDLAATSTDPEGQVCHALAAYSRGDHERVGPWLERASRGLADLPEPRRLVATTVHRLLDIAEARRVGDPYRMYRSSSEAERLVATLPVATGSRTWGVYTGMAGSMMGVAELWLGRPVEAERRLTEAVVGIEDAHFGAHGQIYHGGLVALARVSQGRIAAGRALAEELLDAAATSGWSESYEAGGAWLTLAIVHLHAADRAAADRCLATARRSGIGARDPFVGAVIALVAARVALTGGDLAGARRALAEADRATPPRSRMSLVTVLRGALEAEIALAAGVPAQASAILAALDRRRAEAPEDEQGPPGDPVAITRGHVLLRMGRPAAVLDAVAALRDADGAGAGEAWLLTSLAQDRERHDASAIRALERAIDLSAGEGAVLGFLRANDRLPTLLRRHLDVTGTHAEFVERVLEHLARPARTHDAPERPQAEANRAAELTERELSVLAYLPTLSTNPEIAERLNISVNTVKQHLKTINRKLGVNSRREAVRVARRLGLLPDR